MCCRVFSLYSNSFFYFTEYRPLNDDKSRSNIKLMEHVESISDRINEISKKFHHEFCRDLFNIVEKYENKTELKEKPYDQQSSTSNLDLETEDS